LTQVKNSLPVLAVPVLPMAAVLPAVAMAASDLLALLFARLCFIGQARGRRPRRRR